MLVQPSAQFHLGMIVDDFEAARQRLTDALGYEWGADMSTQLVVHVPEGPITFQHRLQYSVTEPRFELIQAVAGTPYQPSTSMLHHLGYWCADVDATAHALSASGWTRECWGEFDDGSLSWGYFLNPSATRIELVSLAMKGYMEEALFEPVVNS